MGNIGGLMPLIGANGYWLYGNITGDAKGNVNKTGASEYTLRLVLDKIPAAGQPISVDYGISAGAHSDSVVSVNGNISTTLNLNTAMQPGTLEIAIAGSGQVQPTETDPDITSTPSTLVTGTLHLRDDGNGNIIGDVAPGGVIDYNTGALTCTPRKVVETTVYGSGTKDGYKVYEWLDAEVILTATGAGNATWAEAGVAGGTSNVLIPIDQLVVPINPDTTETLVPGSIMFEYNGELYVDRGGVLYFQLDAATGAGATAGTINYADGIAYLDDWVAGDNTLRVLAGAWSNDEPTILAATFRTEGAPLRPASTQVLATEADGDEIIDSADQNGDLSGTGFASGDVNAQAGVIHVEFNNPVVPASITYNTIVLGYLPLDPDILGLNPVRLPVSGQVPAFKVGDVVVVHNTQSNPIADITSGDTLDAGRTRLANVRIEDTDGQVVDPDLYTEDLDAGTVTFDTPLDMSAYAAPYTFYHRIEDMALATDVRVNGYITLNKALSHDYPADTTYISSAVIIGDMTARYANLFEQETWTGEWANEPIGGVPEADYNDTAYPLTVSNNGAIQEEWALVFIGSTSFQVIGKHVGQIALGNTNTTLAPTNPNTGMPYFTLDPLGWGSGWNPGNVVRFTTYAATYPLWIARTVLQSEAEGVRDDFRLQIRGNANRP